MRIELTGVIVVFLVGIGHHHAVLRVGPERIDKLKAQSTDYTVVEL